MKHKMKQTDVDTIVNKVLGILNSKLLRVYSQMLKENKKKSMAFSIIQRLFLQSRKDRWIKTKDNVKKCFQTLENTINNLESSKEKGVQISSQSSNQISEYLKSLKQFIMNIPSQNNYYRCQKIFYFYHHPLILNLTLLIFQIHQDIQQIIVIQQLIMIQIIKIQDQIFKQSRAMG